MGFPGFHGFYAGLLPVALFNTALFVQAFAHALKSILRRGVGLRRQIATDFTSDGSPFRLADGSGLGSSLLMLSAIEEIRRALPVTVYDPSLHSCHKEAKCAVCLLELQSGEEIRGLPYCDHVFHKTCLDRCLDYQQNRCPLCRSSLQPEEVAGKLKKREQELAEEMTLWLPSAHGSAGLW